MTVANIKTRLNAGIASRLLAYSGLVALVAARIYSQDSRPDNDPLPAVEVQCISSPHGYTLTGSDGRGVARYQFTAIAAQPQTVTDASGVTIVGADEVAGQIVAAFDGFHGTMGDVEVQAAFVIDDGREVPKEEGLEIYGVQVDVQIIYTID